MRRTFAQFTTFLLLLSGLLFVGGTAPAWAAPTFYQPFVCGSSGWFGSTYDQHVPNIYAIDFNKSGNADAGQPVVASASGTIVRNPYTSSSNPIAIDHDGGGWQSGWSTFYLHMTSSIANGTVVQAGDTIGYVSDVGAPAGAHLHYEQRFNGTVQPASFTNWSPPYNSAMRTGLGVSVPASDNCSGSTLRFIKTKNTGTGRVEVHSVTAASGYQSGVSSATRFSTADQSNGWFQMVGNDLWFIKTRNTGTGRVEVHSVTAASGYQSGVSSATRFSTADQSNGWFQIGER